MVFMYILNSDQELCKVEEKVENGKKKLIITNVKTGKEHHLVPYFDDIYKRWGWVRENWVKTTEKGEG